MYLRPPVIGNFKTTEKKPKSRAHRQDEGHLAFIRTLPCCVCFADPPNDPQHLLIKESRGVALKAEDWNTVPLCRKCHDRLHREAVTKTEHQWFVKNGVQWIYQLADRLWRNSGDYEMACLIVEAHRS